MKCGLLLVLLSLAGVGFASTNVATSSADSGPVNRVVALLRSLESKVETEGKVEQRSYDKYACWTENTMNRLAAEMEAQRKLLKELEAKIMELAADIASHSAEIKQLNKDIAENKASQKEATDLREKENTEYMEEKTESEQCIGALEAAIKVLTGAGTGRFLQQLQEAQLLSVVAGVREVLKRPTPHASANDLDVVKRFVAKPEAFVGRQGLSATQTGQNPFGDYAPQSTQIQGVLKGLYDGFTSDLEKSNAEEAEKQKAYEQFMATKKQELLTLEKTLTKHEVDKGTKTSELAESKALKADTEKELDANEALFEETKAAGRETAKHWAQRTRLRTEELAGIAEAIQILSGKDAQETFRSARTTFMQLKSISRHTGTGDKSRAYHQLAALATRYHTAGMGRIVAAVQNGGHFDKVIVMIDEMIALLRQEEQDDIAHRDRCQNAQDRNKNEMEDLNHDISKADEKLNRMDMEKKELEDTIETIDGEINTTQDSMDELLDMRNQESASFRTALKDDSDAIGLLEEAIVALSKFYKSNKIPLSLQQKMHSRNYTIDEDKAPELVWGDQGGNYGGAKSESRGIIAILSMIKEDLEKEMITGRQNDAASQAEYEKQRSALEQELDAKVAAKIANEKELAKLVEEVFQTEEHKDAKNSDLQAEGEVQGTLYQDCSWVKTHFESRRQKRKDEIQGLQEAKNFLAGVDAGDDVLPP